MFWETLWALVLGFTLVGRGAGVRVEGPDAARAWAITGRRPSSARRAFGMVSSSCSYAATAMAKSLFQKGADFMTAMVFMFASTNLVVELGIVLLVLMGWQFALAEFVGGPIMIVLLALIGGFVFAPLLVDAAAGPAPGRRRRGHRDGRRQRRRSDSSDAVAREAHEPRRLVRRRRLHDGRHHHAAQGARHRLRRRRVPHRARADATCGTTLFMQGHGFWTSLENVIVGPFIAVISFVCSIGNVPMAAALWHGGISFGGVVSFIFADLITIPLLLIYRKYYGTRLTLRMFVCVLRGDGRRRPRWSKASSHVSGGMPTIAAGERSSTTHFQWNYTTFLNIAALAVLRVPLLAVPQPRAARRRRGLRDRSDLRDAGRDGQRARRPTMMVTPTTSAATAAASASRPSPIATRTSRPKLA